MSGKDDQFKNGWSRGVFEVAVELDIWTFIFFSNLYGMSKHALIIAISNELKNKKWEKKKIEKINLSS